MTIAQALKEKNKKAAKINKLWQKIYQHNSALIDAAKPYDLDKVWDEIQKETAALIELKTKIHAASAPVRKDIFTLSELKSHITKAEGVNTTSGKMADRYSGTVTEYAAHFGIFWKDNQIEALECTIDSIQERLDKFNHTTEI